MKIFIGQVVSACKAHLPVDHGDLPVVAVVQEQVEAGRERVEHAALDPILFRALYEIRVDKAEAPHVIIEHPDFNAGFGPLCQHVPDLMPALGILDRVVFHKDEFLRLSQIPLLCFEPLFSVIKILDNCLFIDRISRLTADILHNAAQAPVSCHGSFSHIPIGRQHRQEESVNIFVTLAHPERVPVEADQQIERSSEDRQEQDHEHPGHTDGSCLMASVDLQHQNRSQYPYQ